MSKYLLKLTRLDFVSPVDSPAQETAKVLLIKRKGEVDGTASVVKINDELGLVFCWAFTSKSEGADYYDLHGDKIDEDFIAAAADFMEKGGAVDEMHDGEPDGGRVVFAMPMVPEVAKAFGIECDTVGLMVALKPSPDVLAKFKSGEYTGVSIAGVGERVQARKAYEMPIRVEVDTSPFLALAQRFEHYAALLDKSTRSTGASNGGHNMTLEDATAEIEALKAKLAETEKRASMTDADRQAEIEKSDPVAYRGEVSGITVRKSEATTLALALAKAYEDQAVLVAKRDAEIIEAQKATEIEKAAREMSDLKKRASEALPNFAGSDDTRAALYKAAELIGDEAVAALKGYESVATLKSVTAGMTEGSDKPAPTEDELYNLAVSEQLVADGIDPTKATAAEKSKATAAVLNTKKGAALYAAVQKRIKSKNSK